MPALLAYLLTITVFLGGGYTGLRFLAGEFDPPVKSQTVAQKPQAAGQKAKSAPALATPSQGSDTDATPLATVAQAKAPADPSTPAADAEPSMVTSVKRNTVATATAEPVIEPVAPSSNPAGAPVTVTGSTPDDAKPDTAKSVANLSEAQASLPRTDAPITAAAAPTPPVTTPPATSVAGNPKADRNRKDAANSYAAMVDSPKSLKRKLDRSREAKQRRPAVVMVLRTVEFPDGRREQRLITQRQAQMDRAVEAEEALPSFFAWR